LRDALITLTALTSLAGGCSRDVRPDTTKSTATSAQVPEAQQAAPKPRSPASIVGDTFLLVAMGDQSTRVPVSDSAPCGFLPYMRLVISNETHFYHVKNNEPTCFGPATDSAAHYSGEWSTYRIAGDTLHLFQGDGNETFYWVSGILSADSLVEVNGDKPFHFVRIRPRVTP
jgi:hypothetical protein